MRTSTFIERVRELRLRRPRDRSDARAKRDAARRIRRDRDNDNQAERRAAPTDAESRRQSGLHF